MNEQNKSHNKLKISFWGEYNLHRNRNNQKLYMINKNQRCKMVTSLKPLGKYLCTNILDSQNPSSRVINIFTKLNIEI